MSYSETEELCESILNPSSELSRFCLLWLFEQVVVSKLVLTKYLCVDALPERRNNAKKIQLC